MALLWPSSVMGMCCCGPIQVHHAGLLTARGGFRCVLPDQEILEERLSITPFFDAGSHYAPGSLGMSLRELLNQKKGAAAAPMTLIRCKRLTAVEVNGAEATPATFCCRLEVEVDPVFPNFEPDFRSPPSSAARCLAQGGGRPGPILVCRRKGMH